MIYIDELEFIHQSGDLLYPVKRKSKLSGLTAFQLVPFGMHKTKDLLEVEDKAEAIKLVLDKNHSIRCSTQVATVLSKSGKKRKREGIYRIQGHSIIACNFKG